MVLGEPRPEVSVVIENYLQAFYKLWERGERVAPTHLAEAMGVSVATAVGTLKRMAKQGLTTVSNGKEVTLTARGQELGESVVRRHRLAECMLTELLDVEWSLAHAEAHRLEHAISPHVEDKLAKALDYPKTNPYGCPIPGYAADLQVQATIPLSLATVGEETEVKRVPDEDVRLLQFFDQIGLKPGARVTVVEAASYKGTITVALVQGEAVVGMEVARSVMVVKAENGPDYRGSN